MAVHPHYKTHRPASNHIRLVRHDRTADRAPRDRLARVMIAFCIATMMVITFSAIAAFVFDTDFERRAEMAAAKTRAQQEHVGYIAPVRPKVDAR